MYMLDSIRKGLRGLFRRSDKNRYPQDKAQELAIILNHIPMGVYWKNADLVYMGGNAMFGGLSGLGLDKLSGKTDMDLHAPEVAMRFREEDMAFLSGQRKEMYFIDKFVPMKDGPGIWARTYKIPVYDDNGNILYIMGLIQDVTKTKKDEIALSESESRLRTVFNATKDYIAFVDGSCEILIANGAFTKDVIQKFDEGKNKNFSGIVPPLLFEEIREKVQKAISSGLPDTLFVRPGDTPLHKYLDVTIYPVATDEGILGTAIYAEDVTERKQAEEMLLRHSEKLQAAMIEAENANKSKSEFLSRMSHEIRTPIGGIIGMTKIAYGSDDIEKIKSCLEKIDSSSKHLLGIINDVLDMSKIEADKFVLSEAGFRLENMLIEAANLVNVRADEKKQDFEVILDPTLPEYYYADELRLRQVITNLLSNAIKFTPEQGTIRLRVNGLGMEDGLATVEIAVSDTGIGITPEQQGRLFQAFEQADGGISRKFGGTGLGLAICKKIVEMMDGRIWVQSSPGAGSTFTFNVKMKVQEKNEEKYAKTIKFPDMKALIVDDSYETRVYLEHILTNLGISSESANDGYQALAKAQEATACGNPFNIIFMDCYMPGMDGIETTKKVKSIMQDNVIVIMISITEWDRIEKEALEAGVSRFLAKPLFPSTVLTVLQEIAGIQVKREIDTDKKGVPNLSGYRLLVAEDIEINREIAAAILGDTNASVDFAVDGREAVAKYTANKQSYDLILMDLHMPEMDGYEATRIIRANDDAKSKQIPILAMTADAFKEDIDKCLSVGMNDHIAKPINEDELFRKILACL